MNGINPNAMNPMVNGANGVQRPSESMEEMKTKLNTYIYDYFLRNEQFELARQLKASTLIISTLPTKPGSTRKLNGEETGEDVKDDLDTKKPADLPYAQDVPAGANDNSFLLDWFQIFWEMFFAPRKNQALKPSHAVQSYMVHQKDRQQLAQQNGMPNGMMNAAYPGMMRGGPAALNMAARNMQGAHPQMRNMTPAAQQQQLLLARQQQMMQSGQMGREGGDMDMGDPNLMGAGQFNFQGQNQKKNLDAYAQNMAQTTRQGMQQNMQGQMMPQQGMEEFYGAGPNGVRAQLPNGQGGNHALQDYQMQLMLLEQQNKKRLLMARQEQDQTRPEGQAIPGQGFAPNMSPQGSRSGPSPNPNEQMKRGTPKMGQAGLPGGPNSPMPDGNMHQRGSPGAMAFNGMEMMQQGMKGVDGMAMPPNMRPPGSHPNFTGAPMDPASIAAMRARGMVPNGGNWQMAQQGQAPGMPQGGQPGQQMGTPQQRAMPPPQNVPNGANGGRPASPAQSATANTPQPANKAAPAKKGKAGKDNKKQPAKKGAAAAAATPSAEEPPQTPTPATPITPMHASSFKDGKAVNGVAQATTGQPNAPTAAAQAPPPQDVNLLGQFDPMEGLENHGALNMHFGGMDTGDVLEQFDFDAFLDTGDQDFNLDAMGSYGNFEGLEAGTGGDP